MSVPKRFIIISNSEGEIFEKAMQQQTSNNPEILYLKLNEYGKRRIAGDPVILWNRMRQKLI